MRGLNIFTCFFLFLVLVSFAARPNHLAAANDFNERHLHKLFDALRSGNAAEAKSHFKGNSIPGKEPPPLDTRHGIMLQNKYQGATFILDNATRQQNGQVLAKVRVFYPDGAISNHSLLLEQDNGNGWVIVEELETSYED